MLFKTRAACPIKAHQVLGSVHDHSLIYNECAYSTINLGMIVSGLIHRYPELDVWLRRHGLYSAENVLYQKPVYF
jgi:hypothetical protein